MALPRGLCGALLALAAATVHADLLPGQVHAATREPRAFGYQVGDVVSRTVDLTVADGLVLDESSVPQPGARGNALELRSVARRSNAEPGGRRHQLTLTYQVFLSPPQTRTLEMPAFRLRFQGQPRAQEVRIDAWPVTVSPLVPVDVSPRRGLGELQPDAAPLLLDTRMGRWRLLAYAGVLLALLAYFAHVYIGLPWWTRAHRPFAQAWRALRGLPPASSDAAWRQAVQQVHGALNQTMGEVVFEEDIPRFVAANPRFAHLGDDLAVFFQQSRLMFFGDAPQGRVDAGWLKAFCRCCRDAERGSA